MGKPINKNNKKGGKKNKGYRPPRKNNPKPDTKQEATAKSNPFESQVNKRKHITLGRQGRQEMGHPSLARSRGITKRKGTLLKDYLTRHKTNALVDRRIGERSTSLPEDAKLARRSMEEKKRQYKRKSIFNLNDDDDEILTHGGQSIANAGRYDDPRESSDSEDERLNEAFVGEANFGGFMKKKTRKEGDEAEEEKEKTREEIIAELILASKERKHQKANADSALYEQILKLDESLKDSETKHLLDLCRKGQAPGASVPPTQSAYDRSLKELQFEKRGLAGDPLKTAEKSAVDNKAEEERKVVDDFLDKLDAPEKKIKKPSDLPATCKYILQEHKMLQKGVINIVECCALVDYFAPPLFSIVGMSPLVASQEFLLVINKYNEKLKLTTDPYEKVGLVLLISKVFSRQELKHQVIQPALMFILRMIMEIKPEDGEDVRLLLSLCGAILELTKENKRYCPELADVLTNLLVSFDKKQRLSQAGKGWKLELWDLDDEEEELAVASEILFHVEKTITLYKDVVSASEVFEPLKLAMKRLKKLYKKSKLLKTLRGLIASLQIVQVEKETLETKRVRPKMLRLYEPELEYDVSSPAKKAKTSKEEGWLAKKVKSETKSAIRELKKDNAFLGRQQWKEGLQNDAERNEKVKALMGSLANQEGEYQKLKKTK